MCRLHYVLYTVHCSMYTEHFTLLNVLCTLPAVLLSVHFVVYKVHYNLNFKLYCVHSTLTYTLRGCQMSHHHSSKRTQHPIRNLNPLTQCLQSLKATQFWLLEERAWRWIPSVNWTKSFTSPSFPSYLNMSSYNLAQVSNRKLQLLTFCRGNIGLLYVRHSHNTHHTLHIVLT